MIKVPIAADHPVVRQGIRQIVAQSSDIEIAGEATTGPETREQVLRLLPDLVPLDITMPALRTTSIIWAIACSSRRRPKRHSR